MINAHALDILDFHRVRQALARHVTSPLGRYKALALEPLEDLSQIQERLDQIEELAAAGRVTLSGVRDVLPLVQRARDSQLLIGAELIQILGALQAAAELRAKLLPEADRFPALARLAAKLGEHGVLARQIAQQIDSGGAVKDDATPKLRRVRERLAPMRGRIHRALEEAMGRYATMLQDRLITVRRDRYVIPIKAEYAGRLGGIVLDASDSGATVYMEPAEVVPLNNELARLKIEEDAEVQRILAELAGWVAGESGLDETLDALGDYDLVGARWLLAQEWRCSRPQFGVQGYLFREARHSLIPNAVPNTIDLTRNRLLVITGPNMGGKTVVLKTAGLLTAMAHAGLFLPVEPNSQVALTRDILVDIGDEQSLEASLSTFAAHLVRLEHIVQEARPGYLVLIDELGSGTDPAEGAALALAILEKVYTSGSCGLITTHLAPLKAFALEREGAQNASMAFDLAALAPTFQLQVGHPGRSYAIAIAERLGLAPGVISRSRELIGPEGREMEVLLEAIERDRGQLAQELAQARQARETAEAEAARLAREYAELERESSRLIQEASARAEEAYRRAMQQAKELSRQARSGGRDAGKAMAALAELQAGARRTAQEHSAAPKLNLAPGARIYLSEYRAEGVVLRVDGDQVTAQVGALKMTVPVASVRPPDQKTSHSQAPGVPTEFMVRPQPVEEVLFEVEEFLQDAYAAGATPVRIVHGQGTAQLRQAIHQKLRSDKRVASFRHAPLESGGPGVTVVNLKLG